MPECGITWLWSHFDLVSLGIGVPAMHDIAVLHDNVPILYFESRWGTVVDLNQVRSSLNDIHF